MEGTVGQVRGSYDCHSLLAWIHVIVLCCDCLKSRSMSFDSSPTKRFSLRLAPNRPCMTLVYIPCGREAAFKIEKWAWSLSPHSLSLLLHVVDIQASGWSTSISLYLRENTSISSWGFYLISWVKFHQIVCRRWRHLFLRKSLACCWLNILLSRALQLWDVNQNSFENY
jgi:hypothetical protein